MEAARINVVQNRARMLLEQLMRQYPEYTGKLILNFHRGNLSEKATMETELKQELATASSN